MAEIQSRTLGRTRGELLVAADWATVRRRHQSTGGEETSKGQEPIALGPTFRVDRRIGIKLEPRPPITIEEAPDEAATGEGANSITAVIDRTSPDKSAIRPLITPFLFILQLNRVQKGYKLRAE